MFKPEVPLVPGAKSITRSALPPLLLDAVEVVPFCELDFLVFVPKIGIGSGGAAGAWIIFGAGGVYGALLPPPPKHM